MAGGRAGYRLATGFLGWPRWKQAVLLVACLVGAVWVVQVPWRPLLGLLGLMVIAAAVLAVNAGGLRDRVPLLGSPNPAHLVAGWAAAGGLLLLTGALAVASAGPHSPAGQPDSRLSSPPRQTAAPALADVPSPTPTPVPTPTPATVTFLNAPLSVRRGQTVTLLARTAPNTQCSTTIGYPSAPDLDPARSDAEGNVSWTWHVGSHTQRGSWPISISCGAESDSTQIVVG